MRETWVWSLGREDPLEKEMVTHSHQEVSISLLPLSLREGNGNPLPSGSFYKPLTLIPQRADRRKTSHRKLIKLITWTTALSNSMKLSAMSFRATQDGQVMAESSDKRWFTGEGNGPSVLLPWETHEQCKNAKRYDTERWTPLVNRCPICNWRIVEK